MGIIELHNIKKYESANEKNVHIEDMHLEYEVRRLTMELIPEQIGKGFSENAAKAKQHGADLVIDLANFKMISYGTKSSHPAGTYTFTINDEKLLEVLMLSDMTGFVGTYEEYVSDRKEDAFNKNYKNINYIVTGDDGTIITNVKNYTEQQAPISQYEFYITGSDGEYFSNKGAVYTYDYSLYDDFNEYNIIIEHRPTSVHEVHTAVPTTMPETTDATTYKVTQYTDRSSSAGIAGADLVVYFNSDAVFYGESIAQMKANLMNAGSFSRSAIINVVLGIGFYLAALILLCISNSRMSHTLLVVTLIISEAVSALLKSLTDTDNAAVAEYAENTVNKFCFNSVKANVLIIKEFNESLSHCKFHNYFSLSRFI